VGSKKGGNLVSFQAVFIILLPSHINMAFNLPGWVSTRPFFYLFKYVAKITTSG